MSLPDSAINPILLLQKNDSFCIIALFLGKQLKNESKKLYNSQVGAEKQPQTTKNQNE